MSFSQIFICSSNELAEGLSKLQVALERTVGPEDMQRFMQEFKSTKDSRFKVVERLCTNTKKYAEFKETPDGSNLMKQGEKMKEMMPFVKIRVQVDAQSAPKRAICEAWTTAEGEAKGKVVQLFDLAFSK